MFLTAAYYLRRKNRPTFYRRTRRPGRECESVNGVYLVHHGHLRRIGFNGHFDFDAADRIRVRRLRVEHCDGRTVGRLTGTNVAHKREPKRAARRPNK